MQREAAAFRSRAIVVKANIAGSTLSPTVVSRQRPSGLCGTSSLIGKEIPSDNAMTVSGAVRAWYDEIRIERLCASGRYRRMHCAVNRADRMRDTDGAS